SIVDTIDHSLTVAEQSRRTDTFIRERAFYKQEKRRPLCGVEAAVPWSFMALYAASILITLIFSLG
ncbi:hypothetical protein ACFHYO_11805, partial [Paracoccus panacisoli]